MPPGPSILPNRRARVKRRGAYSVMPMARLPVRLLAASPLAGAVIFLAATGDGTAGSLLGPPLRLGMWTALLWGGARLAARAAGSRLTGLSHLAWDGSVALSALMGLLLAAGQMPGLYRPAVLTGVPLAVGLAGLLVRRRGTVASGTLAADPGRPQAGQEMDTHLPAGLLPALGVIAGAGLVWSRVPPTFFDTLAYHYAQPGLWLAEGVVAPVSWSLMSWFPAGMSALYGLGLAWGGEAAAADANLLMGLLLLLLAADTAGRLAGPAAAWAAFLLLAGLPLVLHGLAIPAADLAHGTLAFASLAACLLWRREGAATWRHRAAWLAGGAAVTKYLGLLLPVALGAVILTLARPGERPPAAVRARRAAAFLLPALLLLTPWLAANARVTGNPVAPVLAGILPVEGLAPGGAEAFATDARGGLPGSTDVRRLATGMVLGEADGRVYPSPAWGWGLPLLLVAAVAWGRPLAASGAPLALAAAGFAVWFLTFRWERFLVTVSALLVVGLAGPLVAAWRRRGAGRLVVALAALLALLGAARAAQSVARFTGGWPVAAGLESPSSFRERSFPFARLYQRTTRRLTGSEARVLLLGEMRHHGLDVPHAAPAGFNVHPLVSALEREADAEGVARFLRSAGFTHLLVDPDWVDRSARRYPSLTSIGPGGELRPRLAAFLSGLGPPVDVEGRIALHVLPVAANYQRTAIPNLPPPRVR